MKRIGVLSVLLVAACEWDVGPTSQSSCEAMCSWAVTCHAEERTVDAGAMTDACLAATYAVDQTCEEADVGALPLTGVEELTACIDAVDARRRSLDCDPFTGTEDAIRSGTAPPQCIGAGRDAAGAVFEAARDATLETSPELCERVRDALCAAAERCIGPVTDEQVATVGEPRAVCEEALDGVFTDRCRGDERYAPGEDATNPVRDAARRCLAGTDGEPLVETECELLYAADLDPTCAAALGTSAERLGVGGALQNVAETYATK